MSPLLSIIDIQGSNTTTGQRHTTRVPPFSRSVRRNWRSSQVGCSMFSRPYTQFPNSFHMAHLHLYPALQGWLPAVRPL